MAYRSSTGELGFYDDEPPRRPAERWDRERFERVRSRGPEGRFHSEERDRSDSRRPRRNTEIEFNERDNRGSSRTKVEIRDRAYEDEKSRRRPEFLDREESTPSEVANRALAPYRRKSVVDRDYGPPARRPTRPQFIRRQSSLDTFDRRPLPRYGDRERDEWRPPTNVPIPLPIRERSSRPKSTYREDDFEEYRYRDSEPELREDYRDIEIRRERSTHRRRRRSNRHKRAQSSSSSSSSSDSGPAHSVHASSIHSHSVHEPPPRPRLPGKKGKTRMPKRLVHKSALLEKGFEFDEEDDFYIVRRALEKEQIDDVIKISETYKESSRVTYRYEENAPVDPPPPPQEIVAPPPPPSSFHGGPPPGSFHDHHSNHAPPPPPSNFFPPPHQHGPPPPPDAFFPPPPPPPSHHHHHQHPPGHNIRTVSPSGRTVYEERVEESNHINGPLTVLAPRRPRGEREIREEIRSLEEERRVVRLERESDYEVVESKPRDVVRVEKDRKAKRPNPLLVAAMVSTLT